MVARKAGDRDDGAARRTRGARLRDVRGPALDPCLPSLVDCLSMGVVVLDLEENVLLVNKVARELIGDASSLRIHGHKLASDDPVCTAKIRDALRAVIQTRRERYRFVHLASAKSDAELRGIFVRLEGAECCALFLADHSSPAIWQPEILRLAWGLTPTETRVALAVVEHDRVADAAASLRMSPETVRSHLKRIHHKTGTHRRSALVKKICLGLATIRLP